MSPADAAPLRPLKLCDSQGFTYAAFISWPHALSERGMEIVEELARSLEDSFRTHIDDGRPRVFFDKDRMKAGYKWADILRRSVCRSVVVIPILVPTYFDSEYCSIEWGIAEALGRRRLPAVGGHTAFIPITLVPMEELVPPSEVGSVQFEKDFEDLIVWGDEVKTHPKWRKLIENLRKLIFDQIRIVCANPRNWEEEEQLAQQQSGARFSWPQLPDLAPAPFPSMKAVESK